MERLTWKPERVLKWVLSCKAPKTSKDVAKHFFIEEATGAHYLRLLAGRGLLKVHYQKNRFKYYGNPNLTPPPELEKEPITDKPPKNRKAAAPVLPNVANPSKLEDVWGRVVRG